MHKNPWKTRPVVSTCGTYLHALSRWIDYHLQKLTPHIPTYIKDSDHLNMYLRTISDIPPHARLLAADAVSMYTNIETTHALKTIGDFLQDLQDQLPSDFPVAAIIDGLSLIMKNNVFEFGDLYFKQKQGTAMGTPVACIYATIYYGYYEKNFLLPKYGDDIMVMKRFIDDMFVIWTGTPARLQEFQEDLPFGLLTWDSLQPSNSVNFLDLTISINVNRQITTKTYQKALNLYLYIPAASAHSNGMINGIIYNLIKQFYTQNSEQNDFIRVVALLYKRFCARGWEQRKIKQIILEAIGKAQQMKHLTQ
ncbi:hypothetical protein ACHAXS_012435 [Conticribra weissflogii]